MARKLMMNNIENNVLSPVTDGLVCWLDDRDAFDNDRIYDRMKLNDFLLEGNFGGNPYFLNNEHKFYSVKNLNVNNYFTISMTISVISIGGYGIFLAESRVAGTQPSKFKICNRNNDKIGLYSNLLGGINEGVPIILNKAINVTVCFEYNNIIIYGDKKLLITDVKQQTSINYALQLGTYKNVNADISSFKLHSFKIYNRVLKEEEIIQNNNYEKSITRT